MARSMKASERRRGNMTSPVLTLLGVSTVLFASLFIMKRAIHNVRPQDIPNPPPPTRAHKSASGNGTSPAPPAGTGRVPTQAVSPAPENTLGGSTGTVRQTVPTIPPEAVDEATEEPLDENPEENQEESPEEELVETPQQEQEESPEEVVEESPEEPSPETEPVAAGRTPSPAELLEAEIPPTGSMEAPLRRRRRHHRADLKPWLVGQLDRDRWHQQERVQIFRMPPLP
ncbi:histone H3.v1-like [Amphibalanus amphitrite]|uniref:histone H3.v1-like n=1 Tax=Amphibalanus amphitrite TaxID=1232801 RepID=UPI001C8FB65F|nr:histone H3.v1-like [Amphibalanus amphitrite]